MKLWRLWCVTRRKWCHAVGATPRPDRKSICINPQFASLFGLIPSCWRYVDVFYDLCVLLTNVFLHYSYIVISIMCWYIYDLYLMIYIYDLYYVLIFHYS